MTTVLTSDILSRGALANTLEEGFMTLEQVVRRIASDSAFAAAFRADPEATLRQEGVQLDRGEVRAISAALKQPKTPNAEIPWYEAQLGVRPT